MADSNRFYLVCPYAEKNEAKQLGARWDADARKWYVPNDIDRNPFKQWWPAPEGEEGVIDADTFRDGERDSANS